MPQTIEEKLKDVNIYVKESPQTLGGSLPLNT